ncbi:MAG: hypothetical protein Q8932_09640 [Bacteroidota bacterium]|nr:hypothetical protein [Bacteroidota bacterium]MDP4246098.1 hypothetical protein [Bacteroidota bacterium]MDP4254499.1 hypothetical protein [Bacteroidota bacterium]
MQKAIIFLGSLFFACTVHAQSAEGGNASDTTHRPGMHRNWAHRDGRDGEARRFGRNHIHFSPDQRKQMQVINADYKNKAADLFKNDNQTLGQYKAGLLALQKDRKSKLQALLTPEQKEQMEKRRRHFTENAQVRAAARMERLKIHLNLSDQQVATIKSKETDLRSQMQSLHDNDGLLPREKMEKFRELGAQRKEIVKSVLTPDQLSKFNEMRQDHGSHRDGFRHDEDAR